MSVITNRHTHLPFIEPHESRTLYHFTSNRAAKKIARQGLKSIWVTDMPKELAGEMRGVWLTDDPQLPPKYSRSAEQRIELIVSRNDSRLIHWRSTVQDRVNPRTVAALDLRCPEWTSFYFYLGDINPASILRTARYSSWQEMRNSRDAHFERLAEIGLE